MIAVIDYGAGNIRSVENALLVLGQKAVTTEDPDTILAADHVILPGVGAFGDAMKRLDESGLSDVIREVAGKGTPFLGICLGLQLMFEESEESPGVRGLALLGGSVKRLPDGEGRKIPQIGWNRLSFPRPSRLYERMEETGEEPYVYFVHSYYLEASDPQIVTSTCDYGTVVHASVEHENLFACQFHPEKSSRFGMHILQNFVSI